MIKKKGITFAARKITADVLKEIDKLTSFKILRLIERLPKFFEKIETKKM